MRLLKLLVLLLLMALGAAFAVMNPENVLVDYYFGRRELPLAVMLLGVLIAFYQVQPEYFLLLAPALLVTLRPAMAVQNDPDRQYRVLSRGDRHEA